MHKNIFILSDMHVGIKARCKSLCPTSQNKEDKLFDEKFRLKFKKFVDKRKLKADYLIIPGDITTKGKEDEFILASEIVTEIADTLGVKHNNIIFVPGNHDANWDLQKGCDSIDQWRDIRYSGMKSKKVTIFNKIFSNANNTLLDFPYFCAWNYDDILFLGYNSAWTDAENEEIHHGDFDNDAIEHIEEYLNSIPDLNRKIKIFIVHHHPINYSDPIPNLPDFSSMTNAGNLLNLLRKYKFDAFIHGHKHNPNFDVDINALGFPIIILSAGSFSSIIDSKWQGIVNNQLHIMKIEGRDVESDVIYGSIENWTFLATGWKESTTNHGIPFKIPFGNHVSNSSLTKELKKCFETEFAKDRTIILKELIEKFTNFKYVNTSTILAVIEDLRPNFKYKVYGDSKEDLALVIPREIYDGTTRCL